VYQKKYFPLKGTESGLMHKTELNVPAGKLHLYNRRWHECPGLAGTQQPLILPSEFGFNSDI